MSTVSVASAPNTNTELDPKLREGAKKVFKVRLLRGRHVDRQGVWDPDAENKEYPPGDPKRNGRNSLRTFQANHAKGIAPEFETTIDLVNDRAYNPPGYPPKYEFVHAQTVREVMIDPTKRQPGETVTAFLGRLNEFAASAKAQSDNALKQLDSMTVDQLKEFAESEEVEVPPAAKSADEIRKAIRSTLTKK